MRKRYIYDKKTRKLVEDIGQNKPLAHFVMEDTKPYWSVASNKMIDGRTQRREDLKATGCRAVDPSEKSEFLKPKEHKDFKFSDKDLYVMDKIYRGQRID